jgi:putative PIN family toxin of toxin-antitoxin system
VRAVIDTNVIFSALYNLKSNAGRLLLLAIEDKIELFSPNYVKEELSRILKQKLQYTQEQIEQTVLSLPIRWVEDEIYAEFLEDARMAIDHVKDVPVLACAMALHCDIISGDKHFHPLKVDIVKSWRLKSVIDKF